MPVRICDVNILVSFIFFQVMTNNWKEGLEEEGEDGRGMEGVAAPDEEEEFYTNDIADDD